MGLTLMVSGLLMILSAKASIHYDWLASHTDKTFPALVAVAGLSCAFIGLCVYSWEISHPS